MKRILMAILLIGGMASIIQAADLSQLRGQVLSEQGDALAGANVMLTGKAIGAATDSYGYFSLNTVPGEYQVEISYIGYETLRDTIMVFVTNPKVLRFRLKQQAFEIGGITVLGERELMPAKAESVTEIRSGEIEHMQATSLGDVLQLLPGSDFVNPSLTSTKQASIRASEIESTADRNQYLGTQVIVDNVPVSNNANLQVDTDANSGTVQRTTENSGIDLRQIPADNIESVEVIRGIPSSKYGDLTSGVVKVNTRVQPEPMRIKYKSNLMDKELNVTGGVSLGKNDFTANLNYANSLRDPRIPDYDYTRVAAQLNHKVSLFDNALTTTNRLYVTRTFDEQGLREDDLLQTIRYNRDYILRWNGSLIWLLTQDQKLSLNMSHSDNHQNSYASRLVSVDNTYVTDLMEPGTAEGTYVQHYTSELWVKGIARNQMATMDYQAVLNTGNLRHTVESGILLRRELNIGEGRIFDPLTPPTISSSQRTRPRSYDDIPALTTSGFYAEDKIKGVLAIPFEIQAGFRVDRYGESDLLGDQWGQTVHPRLNIMLTPFPNTQIRAGYGSTSKSPTLAMLYPNPIYFDVDDVNNYNNVDSLRQVIVSTYIFNRENHELKAAIQNKKEISLDQRIGNVGFSLTAYQNETKGGFAQSLVQPVFVYKYDYPNWPDTTGKAISDSVYTSYSIWDNSADMDSYGLEFSLQTKEIKAIHSRLRVEASWNHTETKSNGLDYSDYYRLDTLTNIYIKPIWNGENSVREKLQVNYRAEFIWKEIGTWLTLELRQTVYDKDWYTGILDSVAVGYLDEYGETRWFDSENPVPDNGIFIRSHPDYWQNIENYTNTWLVNARLSKSLFPGAEFSFYVNNLLNSRPFYQRKRVSESTVSWTQLNPEIYFGVELSVQFGVKEAK